MAIQFIRAAMDSARLRGLDIEEPLREAHIATDLIGRDGTRVTPVQASRVIQALWNATDDELFGVGPKPFPRGTFRMMALGLIHAPDLATALQRLVEFSQISTGFAAIEMTVDGPTTRLSFDAGRQHTPMDQLVVDIVMTVMHRFAGWLIGHRIALISVDLPWPAQPMLPNICLFMACARRLKPAQPL